ncbi:hypothetical protein GCM10027521_31740 [Amycolatopsis cihanbeyliensis]
MRLAVADIVPTDDRGERVGQLQQTEDVVVRVEQRLAAIVAARLLILFLALWALRTVSRTWPSSSCRSRSHCYRRRSAHRRCGG